jgi:chemotaxis signal transduction protein
VTHLTFQLDDTTCAVALDRVVQVAPRVAFDVVPGTSPAVAGSFSLHGTPVVAVDVRRCLGLFPREPALSDHVVVVSTGSRLLGLVADRAVGLVEEDDLPTDRLVVLDDVETLLPPDDRAALEART